MIYWYTCNWAPPATLRYHLQDSKMSQQLLTHHCTIWYQYVPVQWYSSTLLLSAPAKLNIRRLEIGRQTDKRDEKCNSWITLIIHVSHIYWLLIIDYWLLIIDYWLLIIDYWLLIIDYRLSIIDYWLLIIYYLLLIID